jgi:hypothetical protein
MRHRLWDLPITKNRLEMVKDDTDQCMKEAAVFLHEHRCLYVHRFRCFFGTGGHRVLAAAACEATLMFSLVLEHHSDLAVWRA